ncbi:MAG: chitinase [Anaerolineales bacterium]
MSLANTPPAGKSMSHVPAENPSGLPKHILVGYWHNWDARPAAFLPLRDISSHFDVINVAFATSAAARNGEIVFTPHADRKQFEADILYLQERGKKVLISVGGATGSIAIDSPAAQENFSHSVSRIVRQYGFDGVDINLEGNVVLERGDTDFRNPTSASIKHLTAAIRDIRSNFGPAFILSLAPETVNVQGGLSSYRGFSGSYLPIIHGVRDILTYLQVQHYNSRPLAGADHNIYLPGTADFHVAMTEMLLQGFPVDGDPKHIFPPLRPEQIVIGLAAWPAAVNGGYTDLPEIKKALNYLTAGQAFGGAYHLCDALGYGSLRGVMTWSINWDAARHHQFSNAIHSCFADLS